MRSLPVWIENFSVQNIAGFCSEVPKRMFKRNRMGIFNNNIARSFVIMLT